MSTIEQPATEIQPAPETKPEAAPIFHMVIADIHQRAEFGIKKYGAALTAENGRDHLVDAYQEALDLACYIRGELERRRLTHLRLVAAFTAMRKDGNGLTHTQEQVILEAAR